MVQDRDAQSIESQLAQAHRTHRAFRRLRAENARMREALAKHAPECLVEIDAEAKSPSVEDMIAEL